MGHSFIAAIAAWFSGQACETRAHVAKAQVRRPLWRRLIIATPLALIALLGPDASGVHAAPLGQEAPAATAPEHRPGEATVQYFNRDIVTFRAPFLGRAPELRAKTAEENIDRIAMKQGDATVSFKDLPQGMLIMLGGELITIVTPDDLDSLNNETLADVRSKVAVRLADAVAAARRANTPRLIALGAGWSVLATAIALALLIAVRWLGRQAGLGLQRWLERRLLALQHESTRQIALSAKTIAAWLVRIAIWIAVLLVIEEWLRYVLSQFPFTQPWASAMRGWLRGELEDWGEAVARAVPGLAAAGVILLIARAMTGGISATFQGVQSGRLRLFDIDEELAEPTRKIVVAVVWLFAVAMAYPYLPGAQTDAFKGLSVLVGLMVSLGASGIVGQAAGSFTILYSRTMRVGDLVRSGDTEGVVLQIGLFSTRLRTLTGVEVNIPNSVVLSRDLKNFSRDTDGPGMWLETGVTIGYDTPWRQVQRMLLEAAAETANVQANPAPYVLQTALSDFYVEYRLFVRLIVASQRLDVLSELHSRIQDHFNTAGVQIMSPHYEKDPMEAKVVPRDQWDGNVAP